MHCPNFIWVVKVQFSRQAFLKETITDALEEYLHVSTNHVYLEVQELI